MTDMRKWSAGAAALVLAIFAAGWFLLVAPKHQATADLKTQATSAEQANAQLQQQIQVLQAQQQDLPQQQAKLASLSTQIPGNPALPSLIRDLTAAASKVGVSIDSMAPAPPVAVVAPLTAVAPLPPPSTTDSTDTSGGTDSTATTTTTTVAPPVAASTLFQVPLTLSVTGSYFEVEQFLNKLEGLKRSMLISGLTLTPGAGAATATSSSTSTASDGSPSDLKVVLTGRVFLTQGSAPTTTAPVAAPATTTGS
jgi:Tfp pilus assembly protein PilO